MTLAFANGAWTLDGTAYETRDAALDAAVASVPTKARVMPGAWRFWIPASSPDPEGGLVTADAVREMAAELNASPHPRPIDGGSEDAPTHEYGYRGDVPANGWVHRAVVAEVNGQPMMFLECEVRETVAPMLSEGRIAFSSVHVEWPDASADGETMGRAVLVSLGLTNRPANTNLPPIKSVRNGRTFAHVVMRAVPVGVPKMADKETPPKDPPEAAKAEPTMAEVMTKLDEALARIAALEGENVALEAARDVLSAQLTEAVARPAVDPDAEALADVEKAMREGRFGERNKPAMLAMRKASKTVFEATIPLMPKLGERVTLRSEVKPAETQATAGAAALAEAAKVFPEGPVRDAFIARRKAKGV